MIAMGNEAKQLPWLASPYAAASFFGTMTLVPYLLAEDNIIFSLGRVLDPVEHIMLAGIIVLVLLSATHFGYKKMARYRSIFPQTGVKVQSGRKRLAEWAPAVARAMLWACACVSVFVAAYTFVAYRSGSFLTARAALDFQGVGVLLRLYVVALPVYLVSVGRITKEIVLAVLMLFASIFVRAIALSERSAVLEFLIVGSICYQGVTRRSLLKYALAATPFLPIYMALALRDRLVTQGVRVTGDTLDAIYFELNDTLIYYTDTINKLYAGVFQGLTSNEFYFADPFYKLLGAGKVTDVAAGTKALLLQLNSAGLTNSGLSNPGGLAQDFSDFSYFFIPLVIAKFYIFGRLGRLFADENPIGVCLYPVSFVAIFEFARFNYFYNGYGFLLALTFIIFAVVVGVSPRQSTQASYWRRATPTGIMADP